MIAGGDLDGSWTAPAPTNVVHNVALRRGATEKRIATCINGYTSASVLPASIRDQRGARH